LQTMPSQRYTCSPMPQSLPLITKSSCRMLWRVRELRLQMTPSQRYRYWGMLRGIVACSCKVHLRLPCPPTSKELAKQGSGLLRGSSAILYAGGILRTNPLQNTGRTRIRNAATQQVGYEGRGGGGWGKAWKLFLLVPFLLPPLYARWQMISY